MHRASSAHSSFDESELTSYTSQSSTTCQSAQCFPNTSQPSTVCQGFQQVTNSNQHAMYQVFHLVPYPCQLSSICQGFHLVPYANQPSVMCQGFQMVPFSNQLCATCQGFQWVPNNNQPSATSQGFQLVPNTNQPSAICQGFHWVPNTNLHSTMCQDAHSASLDTHGNSVIFPHIEMNTTLPSDAIINATIPIPNHVPRPVHSNQEEPRCIRRSHAINIEEPQKATTTESKVQTKPIIQYAERDSLHRRTCNCRGISRPIIHQSVADDSKATASTKDIFVNNCNTTLPFTEPTEITAAKICTSGRNSKSITNDISRLEYYETHDMNVQRKPISKNSDKDPLKQNTLKLGVFAEPIHHYLPNNDQVTPSIKDSDPKSETAVPFVESGDSEIPNRMSDLTKCLTDVKKTTTVTVANDLKLSKDISKCVSEPAVSCRVPPESVDSAALFECILDQPAAFETVQNNDFKCNVKIATSASDLTSERDRNVFQSTDCDDDVEEEADDEEESNARFLDEFFDDKKYFYGKSLIKRSSSETELRSSVENDLQQSEDMVRFMYGIASPCFSHLAAHSVSSNKQDKKPIHLEKNTRSDCNLSDLVDEVVDELLYATPTNTADISNMIMNDVSQIIHSLTDDLNAVDANTRRSELSKADTNTQAIDLHMSSVHLTSSTADELKIPELRASHGEGKDSVGTNLITSCSVDGNNLPECGLERNVIKYFQSRMTGFQNVASGISSKKCITNQTIKVKPIKQTPQTTVVETKSSEVTKPDISSEQVVDVHPFQSFLTEIQGVSNTHCMMGGITSRPIKPTVCVSEPMAGIDYWDNHCSSHTGQLNGDLLPSCFTSDVKHESSHSSSLENTNKTDRQHYNMSAGNHTEKQQQDKGKLLALDWSELFTSCELPGYRQKRKVDEPVMKEGRIARPPKLLRL